MPRLPKPKELRQNRERRDLGVIVGMPRPVPPLPKDILPTVANAWRSFWGSALSQTVEIETDMQALLRLWKLYDRRERADREVGTAMMVAGSRGQRVLNPLLSLIKDLDPEIRQLEDRFGLTPQARLKLGITLERAQDSLEAINRRLHDSSDEAPEDDPRIIDITPADQG